MILSQPRTKDILYCFEIKQEDNADIHSKVLSLTPQDRKRLGINKSTLWYMQKNIREGKRIKVYIKVMGKLLQ
jgi:CRISPR-associated protein Cas1